MKFDPTIGPRIAPGWRAVLLLLDDGKWHHRQNCIDAMLFDSDLKPKTCSNVLRHAVRDGLLEQFGEWNGPGHDRRFLRIPGETDA